MAGGDLDGSDRSLFEILGKNVPEEK